MINTKLNRATWLVLLCTSLLSLGGCNSDTSLFNSGLAKEWASDKPVSHEALAMNPSYYFRGLGDDLGHIAWLAIPKGKLFQDMRDDQKIRQIETVLNDYLSLLESMPDGKDLPEYQLVSVYHDLAGDYVDYLDGNMSMYAITNKLALIGKDVEGLEARLEEADTRRLSVLLQTFPRYVYSDHANRGL